MLTKNVWLCKKCAMLPKDIISHQLSPNKLNLTQQDSRRPPKKSLTRENTQNPVVVPCLVRWADPSAVETLAASAMTFAAGLPSLPSPEASAAAPSAVPSRREREASMWANMSLSVPESGEKLSEERSARANSESGSPFQPAAAASAVGGEVDSDPKMSSKSSDDVFSRYAAGAPGPGAKWARRLDPAPGCFVNPHN